MKLLAFNLLFWVLLPIVSFSQVNLRLQDTIPMNPNVCYGILKNGLKYYIFKNSNPAKTIELALIEKAGAYHIDDKKQFGVAHFIEHLGYGSTSNFPKGLKAFMTGLGLISGRDLTASTNITTNYNLTIKSGDSVLLKYSLLALRDWAKGRLFLSSQVEQERSAILKECARGQNGYFLALMEGKYRRLDENPIYAPRVFTEAENIESMSVETLRNFDRKWYRPDMQAIIVVGDVDQIIIEEEIEKLFSSLNIKDENNEILPDIFNRSDVPLTGKNKLIVVCHGPDNRSIHLEIMKKRKTVVNASGAATLGELRVGVVDDLYNELSKARLAKVILKDKKHRRGLIHFIGRRAINPLAGIDGISTNIDINTVAEIKPTFKFAMTEIERIRRWGFTSGEFSAAKRIVRENFLNSELRNSQTIISSLQGHFITGAAFAENEIELKIAALSDITVKEINNIAKNWLGAKENTDYLLSVPNEFDPELPNEKDLFSWIKEIEDSEVGKFTVAKVMSLPKLRKEYTVDSIVKFDEIDAAMFKLRNGVRVLIKSIRQTHNQNNGPAILLQGFNTITTKGRSSKNWIPLASAKLYAYTGAGPLTFNQLNEWKHEKNLNGYLACGLGLEESSAGINGAASLNNYEALLQSVYWYFVQPRFDEKSIINSLKSANNQSTLDKSISEIFEDTINTALNKDVTFLSDNDLSSDQIDETIGLFKERFKNASDFTFVITGTFKTEELLKITARYLGALPNKSSVRRSLNGGFNNKNSIHSSQRYKNLNVTLKSDSTGNVHVRMLFPTYGSISEERRLQLKMLNQSLNPLLHLRLRTKEKGVYEVNSNLRTNNNGEYFFEVSFQAASYDLERLISATVEEVASLSKNGISPIVFNNAKELVRSDLIDENITASYWLDYLTAQMRQGSVTSEIFHRENLLNNITLSDIRKHAGELLDCKNYMLFKLYK